jgi:hypothetical protein
MMRMLAISSLWLIVCAAIWVLGLLLTFFKIIPVIQDIEFALGVLTAIGEIIIIKNNLPTTELRNKE